MVKKCKEWEYCYDIPWSGDQGPLPNPDLGLYAMNSLIVLPPRADVARSASTRIERAPPTRYYGADTTP
jgi:hypothetical protein